MNARKQRYAQGDLDDLLDGAQILIAMRGSRVVTFDLAGDPPEPAVLAKAVLGPSGNLRAPTLRMGQTFVVGFSRRGYEELFG